MFASKKHTIAECDMCGQIYKLNQLQREIYNQRFTGFLVCPECLDEDNPQLQLGKIPIVDPQAVSNPRPDAGVESSRDIWGWAPVGNTATRANAVTGNISVNGVVVTPTY